MEDEDTFKDVYDDIREEACKYGRVLSLTIPKKDRDSTTAPPGYGNAYMEFYTLEEAKECRRVTCVLILAIDE
jgi:hypothetical protein